MRIVAVAPRHLGDGVMALPAMVALAQVGELAIRAPGWGAILYRDVPTIPDPGDAADVAVVFPPSIRAAWSVRGVRRRIGVGTPGGPGAPGFDLRLRRPLLSDTVDGDGHRGAVYARLAGAAGARVDGPPRWAIRADDPEVDVPEAHIGLNPVALTGATRAWTGWRALAERLERPVFYAGPGENVAPWAGDHPRCVGLSLLAFARALQRCRVFVSNDTGAAHFARAVGAQTVVIFGSTAPARTGPAGAVAVEGPDPGCRPCYRDTCPRGLGCLDVSVDAVLAAIGVHP